MKRSTILLATFLVLALFSLNTVECVTQSSCVNICRHGKSKYLSNMVVSELESQQVRANTFRYHTGKNSINILLKANIKATHSVLTECKILKSNPSLI